jgi:hypothetical protein
MRSIGWAAVLLTCFTFTVILTFKVNAVKSEVRLAERQILAVKQDKLLLETEFETRANQQQLRSLNQVEFGYQAPAAGQYLEGERQLADLGKARGADAPSPIRVAKADAPSGPAALPEMVNPMTGKAMAAEPARGGKSKPTTDATLSDRLNKVDRREVRDQ